MLDDRELDKLRNLLQDPKPPAPEKAIPVPGAPPKGRVGKYSILKMLGPSTWMCTDGQRPHALVMRVLGVTRDAGVVQALCADLKGIVALKHPVLVTYHKLSQVEANYFVVRDYVEGRAIADRSLEPAQALQAFYEVSRAIEFAHEHGVLHGSLGASNVIIDPTGRPFVVDVGAGLLRQRFRPADATPVAIASPERDIAALGALFAVAMGGRPVCPESDADIAALGRRLAPGGKSFATVHDVAEETARILTEMPAQYSTKVGLMEKFQRSRGAE